MADDCSCGLAAGVLAIAPTRCSDAKDDASSGSYKSNAVRRILTREGI